MFFSRIENSTRLNVPQEFQSTKHNEVKTANSFIAYILLLSSIDQNVNERSNLFLQRLTRLSEGSALVSFV